MKTILQPDLFDPAKAQEFPAELEVSPNPLVRVHGYGPTGTFCKTCRHLWVHSMARNYYKCQLRDRSHGPATDHRLRWPSCKLYEPEIPT